MPNWKRVIVSGSSAHLSHVSSSGDVVAFGTGSFAHVHIGDGRGGLGIGNDDDLVLYHDGSNSYIVDSGSGALFYRGGTQTFQNAAGSKTMATFNAANSVDLNFNNSTKFQTTNTGISVTGDVAGTGNISVLS